MHYCFPDGGKKATKIILWRGDDDDDNHNDDDNDDSGNLFLAFFQLPSTTQHVHNFVVSEFAELREQKARKRKSRRKKSHIMSLHFTLISHLSFLPQSLWLCWKGNAVCALCLSRHFSPRMGEKSGWKKGSTGKKGKLKLEYKFFSLSSGPSLSEKNPSKLKAYAKYLKYPERDDMYLVEQGILL